jgi:CBS domain-containing protein
MLVKDVMSKPVYTVPEDASFEKIARKLQNKKISGVTVVNKKGKMVGMISEKDLIHKLFPKEEEFYKDLEYYKSFKRIEHEAKDISKLTAKKLMTKKVITVDPDRHILVACSLMTIHNIRRLPVVKKGKLLGIVTMSSLYKKYLFNYLK